MRRLGVMLLAGLLGLSGTALAQDKPAHECVAGADGGPVVGDRGIGGTGAPGQVADRGIGGTGAPRVGIRGRITGFGSLCVNGLVIELWDAPRVVIDGRAAGYGDLRVGEVAEMSAVAGEAGRLVTTAVRVTHAVVGPVEAIRGDARRLVVAGQDVMLAAHARVTDGLGAGDWVAVSGMRDVGGVIHASRIDRAPAGRVLVSGQVRRRSGELTIGGLALLGAAEALAGTRVVVEGQYAGTGIRVSATRPWAGLERGAGERMVVEAVPSASKGLLHLGNGIVATLPDGVKVPAGEDEPVVVTLAVLEDGGLTVTSVREGEGRRDETGAPGTSGSAPAAGKAESKEKSAAPDKAGGGNAAAAAKK